MRRFGQPGFSSSLKVRLCLTNSTWMYTVTRKNPSALIYLVVAGLISPTQHQVDPNLNTFLQHFDHQK